jgi:hypothetical protein
VLILVLFSQALRASWGMQKKRLDGVLARRNILEKEVTLSGLAKIECIDMSL